MADGMAMSVGQLMQVSAWGLGLGTLFFSAFGYNAGKDFFLTMGCVACVLGDLAFCAFLAENVVEQADGTTKANETFIAAFLALALVAFYGLLCQLSKYKEEGFGIDDDDDDEPPAADAAAAAAGAATGATTGAGATPALANAAATTATRR